MLKLPSEPYLSPYIRYGISTSLFFILASLFLIAAFWAKLPPQVPLFYSRPWGEEILAPPFFLFILPLASLVILIINFFTAFSLRQNRLLAMILAITSALFSFLAFFNILKIITLTI